MPDSEYISNFKFNWNGLPILRDVQGREQIFIFNTAAGQWEYLSSSPYENAGDYTDDNGKLKIKLIVTEEGDYLDPRIEVKGGVR